ncbi:VanZ family protein [Thalassotalea litorea]|uniref:VanZ family protein n=1 Tax=Thalassotalea litorea TaxID=2020715 RepID=A0A5R9IL59_9GAMM|nr:VanZ family protein [Thalassotalea litorea]TLU65203.1 VanZ family protein [Thalassotalea litorea]
MTQLLILIRSYWVVLTLLLLAIICFLSLYPLAALPPFPGTDKTHHFIAYFALVMPMGLRKPSYWPVVILLFILVGGGIELIQPFVNRYGEWLDLTANVSGVVCGFIFAQMINRIFPDSALQKLECVKPRSAERE